MSLSRRALSAAAAVCLLACLGTIAWRYCNNPEIGRSDPALEKPKQALASPGSHQRLSNALRQFVEKDELFSLSKTSAGSSETKPEELDLVRLRFDLKSEAQRDPEGMARESLKLSDGTLRDLRLIQAWKEWVLRNPNEALGFVAHNVAAADMAETCVAYYLLHPDSLNRSTEQAFNLADELEDGPLRVACYEHLLLELAEENKSAAQARLMRLPGLDASQLAYLQGKLSPPPATKGD